MTEIRGRVAVVTGGGSGIGRGLAMALAEQGVAVGIADILDENARGVVDEIKAKGGRAHGVQCDISDRKSLKHMKADVTAALGEVSLVIANAGATSFERFNDMAENDVDWIVNVNFVGTINTLMTFLPDMIRRNDGHVCATASMAGLNAGWIASHALYVGAKLGIVGLMLNLRMELSEHKIGCTVYCPGGVATRMKARNALYRPQRYGGPGSGEVDIGDFVPPRDISAEYAARWVLQAIKNDRPIVLDHAEQREIFQRTYADYVMKAFDEIADYERSNPFTPKSR